MRIARCRINWSKAANVCACLPLWIFDGFLPDVMAQLKINNAKRQVDEAIRRVEGVLMKLHRLVTEINKYTLILRLPRKEEEE